MVLMFFNLQILFKMINLHLKQLKIRFIYFLIAVILLFFVLWTYRVELLAAILRLCLMSEAYICENVFFATMYDILVAQITVILYVIFLYSGTKILTLGGIIWSAFVFYFFI